MNSQKNTVKQIMILFKNLAAMGKPVDYKNYLKRSSRILISCPAEEDVLSYASIITQFTNRFPNQNVVLLHPIPEEYSPDQYRIQQTFNRSVIFPHIPKRNIFKIFWAKQLRILTDQRFDVFIDLDPNYSFLNIFLCILLTSPIRLSFSKPKTNWFYNLQYKVERDQSYNDKLIGLFSFLKPLFS